MLLKTNRGVSFRISKEDFAKVGQFRWSTYSGRTAKLYVRTSGLHNVEGKKRHIYLSHLVVGGVPSGMAVDHINGDALDNRRENLRLCNDNQNQFNRGKTKKNSSGYKGVSTVSPQKGQPVKYRAELKANGKRFQSRRYLRAEDAARAYNEFAKEHHGEFAYLNDI
jgi:hypothetical protein